MSDGLYRDPLASLRGHVEQLREGLPAREHVLSPMRRAVLPKDTVRALNAAFDAQARALTVDSDLAQVERDVLMLHDAIKNSEEWIEGIKFEATKPLGAPRAQLPSEFVNRACEFPMLDVVHEMVQQHGGTAGVWAPSLHASLGRFDANDVPLLLLGRTTGENAVVGARHDDSEFFLQAPMPLGLSLHVRPSGALLGVLRSVSWVRHAVFGNPKLGDKDFEDEFSVSGGDGIPEVLLVPRLRRWLMLLSEAHMFRYLHVEEDRVELAWNEPYERESSHPRAVPRPAIEIVTGLAELAAEL